MVYLILRILQGWFDLSYGSFKVYLPNPTDPPRLKESSSVDPPVSPDSPDPPDSLDSPDPPDPPDSPGPGSNVLPSEVYIYPYNIFHFT